MNQRWMAAALFVFSVGGLHSPAANAESLDLRQIMADPAWIGNPVEQAWWQLDGSAVLYRVRRDESDLRDLRRIDLADGSDERLEPADQSALAGANPVFHARSQQGFRIFASTGFQF